MTMESNKQTEIHAANLALNLPQVITLAPPTLSALAHILTLFADHTIAYKVGKWIEDHLSLVSLAGSLVEANSPAPANPKDDAGLGG